MHRTSQGENRSSARAVVQGSRKPNATARFAIALLTAGGLAAGSQSAWATCTTAGSTVSCSGAPFVLAPSFSSNANNLSFSVDSTGQVGVLLGLLGNAVTLTGNNVTFNNAGLIDPTLLGLTGLLSGGAVIGNGNASTVSITNSGTLRGTAGLLGVNLLDLNGLALVAQNGAGGITSIVNSGTIGSTPLLGLTLLGSDAPVVAAYGGATVNMLNTGTINGRVAFESSTGGNSFINGGTINGGVSMGAASTNRFTMVTGSSVNSGGSALSVLNVASLNLGFAATGVVDGGAGGDNELLLQNSTVGTGAGSTGTGTVPSGTYINFSRLTVNSGTWTLNGGPLVSGTQTLNGGLVNFNDQTVFGTGTLFANGGSIAPSVAGLNVSNAVVLSGTGLGVEGTNNLTLSGVLSGTGSLRKDGSGTLTLNGIDNYSGGTDLSAGTLRLGTTTALGTGALRASGGTLDVVPAAILGNAVALTGNLDLSGSAALTLAGTVSGAGSLTKNGAADLTLAGPNTFAGGVTLNAGRLLVGSDLALGTGVLAAAAGTTLDASAASNLANNVALAGNLTLGGSNALTLSGVVSGAGGLIKAGAADAMLSGSNTFNGGVALNAGRLVVGSNTALGTGALTAAAGTTLDASAPVSIANSVTLPGILTLGGSNTMTLSGVVSGPGGLTKAGTADATLSGTNAFTGPVAVAAGTLNTVGNAALGATSGIDISAGAALRLGGNANAGGLTGAGALDVGAGATLTLGASGNSSSFGGSLSGAGNLAKTGTGTLQLNGTGAVAGTAVNAGKLLVGDATHAAATLGGTVSVAGGATLAGTGTAGGNVTMNAGSTLAPGDGVGTLRVGGTLTLAQGSILDIGLGTASGSNVTPGVSTGVSVAGDLALNGATLNATDLGGYGPGLYRVFDYGGALTTTNGGLTLGTTPGGTPVIQYLSGAKQINLINAAGNTLAMWNANGAASASQMGGGSGTWSQTAPVWTDAVGSVTAAMQPMPGFAIFGGQAGVVTVDNGAGAVSANGLQFAVDGYRLTGAPLTLAGSGSTPVPQINVGDGSAASAGYTATIDAALAGSAGLAKVGAGTLVLSGANSYTGNTVLTAGTLSVAADSALGAVANAIDFEGGALRVTGTAYNGTTRNIVFGASGGSFDIADANNNFGVASSLGGAGALVKAGAGTLALTGANNYAGGTTIAAGTLQLGNGGTSGSITGNVLDNGRLAFDRSDALAFPGVISGSGTVAQIGSGTTTLGAANTYTGGTTVSAGTLVGSTGSFGSGPIVNNATLVIDQATDAAMGNPLSGTGSLQKTGAGMLMVMGNGAGFVGSTNLAAGSLAVMGTLGGAITVQSGATLAGTGSVGSTTVLGGGIVAPGNAGIGTLNVDGNLVLAPGSVYKVDVSPTSSDQIVASGTATLQGGTVGALVANGNFNPNATYRIVQAAGGLTGTFGALSSNFAFLTPTIAYDATSAKLTLVRNDVSFPSVGTTPNQAAAGAGTETVPTSSPLFPAVVQLDAPSAQSAFEQLGGDAYASTRGAMLDGSHFVRDAAVDALRKGEGEAAAPADASAPTGNGNGNLWVRTFGSWGHTDSDGNAARLKSSVGGVFIGADTRVGDSDWRAGAMGGYSRSNYDVDDRHASSTDDAYHLGVYGGRRWDRLALRLGAFYARHDLESHRTVVFPGFANSLSADYNARNAQAFGELGYRIDAGSVALEPFGNLAHVNLRTDGFTERGGVAALTARGDSSDATFSTLGLRASVPVSWGAADATLRGMVGWRHAFGDVSTSSTMALAGGSDFTVSGLPIARNAVVLEAGLDFAVAKSLTLGVSYIAQAGSDAREQGVKASLLWKF